MAHGFSTDKSTIGSFNVQTPKDCYSYLESENVALRPMKNVKSLSITIRISPEPFLRLKWKSFAETPFHRLLNSALNVNLSSLL